jgi:pimeloyl-ACP methyl ester carboxylesterase/uncharacterized membrane protein
VIPVPPPPHTHTHTTFSPAFSLSPTLSYLALPQLVPVPTALTGRTLYLHAIACGVVAFAVLLVYVFEDVSAGLATACSLLLAVIFTLACLVAAALRGFIREHVVTLLLLPALKVMQTSVMIAPGQASFVHDVVENIRAQYLSASEVVDSEEGRVAFWTSVQIPAGIGATLDAAYLRNPSQRELPATQQRWMLYFLGNGELFEFMLPELQIIASRAGLNIFAFNFRGVGYSSGHPHSAEDLVHDGVLAYEFIVSELGARPEHILMYGHSLGGAIAPLVRAETSPSGPIVSERSFSSLGAAARAVLTNLCKSITGFSPPLPVFIVQGLLNSVFKGHLDVLGAWASISGPKLIVYHTADLIIPYRQASLHHALIRNPGLAAHSLELGTPGNIDFHNVPLRVRMQGGAGALGGCDGWGGGGGGGRVGVREGTLMHTHMYIRMYIHIHIHKHQALLTPSEIRRVRAGAVALPHHAWSACRAPYAVPAARE